MRYFQRRPKKVGFTRSHPYHKNDKGHVEQKNWNHVRQLLGYERLADPAMVAEINALYRELWEPLHNYFCASAKLVSKDRNGAKIKRRHDRPMTPCDRLLASDAVSSWKKTTESRAQSTQSLRAEPAAGSSPAPVAAAGTPFQSP